MKTRPFTEEDLKEIQSQDKLDYTYEELSRLALEYDKEAGPSLSADFQEFFPNIPMTVQEWESFGEVARAQGFSDTGVWAHDVLTWFAQWGAAHRVQS